MKYVIIGICLAIVIAVLAVVFVKRKPNLPKELRVMGRKKNTTRNHYPLQVDNVQDKIVQVEMLSPETFLDESKLVQITDENVLIHVNKLIPEFAKVGNTATTALKANQVKDEVLYKALIPLGEKLTPSREINNAFRGFYHGSDGIRGHANFVRFDSKQATTALVSNSVATAMGVASMVVGQYYMTQINAELKEISEDITKISNFQDNEYRSRVLSVIAHAKRIADFQVEILENNELRQRYLIHLDNLEEETTKLLGQANLTIAGYTKKKDLAYSVYEKELFEIQNWYMYQKSLLNVLRKISDLKYTLNFGKVSREQCTAHILTYEKQVDETQKMLAAWHKDTMKRLGIEIDESKRKREGLDGVVHYIPSLFNEEFKYRLIPPGTAEIIIEQSGDNEGIHHYDTSTLYSKDVQLISKGGKIYFFPEEKND
jgi:hypothetical protein